jgi:hypothetical protein
MLRMEFNPTNPMFVCYQAATVIGSDHGSMVFYILCTYQTNVQERKGRGDGGTAIRMCCHTYYSLGF